MRRFGRIRPNRRNPGWNPIRQTMAPQPDAGPRIGGARPMDHMRRSLPNTLAGNQPPIGARGQYNQFLDAQNPNRDAPLPGGLTDQQVMWMRRNLLGQTGQLTGREGGGFQRQMGRYINQAGGQEAFAQMLGNMPGWQRLQGGVMGQGANRFNPQQPRQPGPPQRGDKHDFGSFEPGRPVIGPPGWQGRPGKDQQAPFPQQPEPRRPFGQQGGLQIRQDTGAGRMFPQQARQFAGQPTPQQPMGQPMQPQTPQGYAQGAPPQQTPPPQQQPQQRQGYAQGPQQPRAQGKPTPQDMGQALATSPAARATAIAYGGETDPKRQKARDRQRFAKRGIPLTPEHEEGMRQLTDQYIQTLISIGYSEADAAAMTEMEKERLSTDYGLEQEATNEAAAEAGVFNSGSRLANQELVSTDYGRRFQDLALQAGQQQRGFADARAAALEAMRAGRQELAMQATRSGVENAYAGRYSGLPTSGRRGRRGRRRGRK